MKKTISFAVMHFAVAFTVAYLLTGSMVVGGVVALVEPAVNTVAFYFHERVWKQFERHQQQYTQTTVTHSPSASSVLVP